MGVKKTLRVMLVEDHAAFREALAFLLTHDDEGDLEVVAQAGSSLAEARGRSQTGAWVWRFSTSSCPTGTGAIRSASCAGAIPASRSCS